MLRRRKTFTPRGNKTSGTADRKTLLLLTPYSPTKIHDHAADDLGRQLVNSLSESYELHIYAPGQAPSANGPGPHAGATYHRGSPPQPSPWRHFGLYPAGIRKDWSRRNTREARLLLRKLRPERVHVEYLQPVESVLRSDTFWTITLHDVTSGVFLQRAARAHGLERPYRWFEFLRALKLEKSVVKRAKRVFTLSARDAAWVKGIVPRQAVSHLRIGIDIPKRAWSSVNCDSATFVFAGAMWRDSNIAAVEFLVQEVMPLVWTALPNAVLRIVGARPSPSITDLGRDQRIEIVGRVPSIEEEYLRASAVLSPSVVDAGVLLKALRALACGAPVILNNAAALPLEVTDGVECYVRNTPQEIAVQMIALAKDPASAEEIASAGRRFVQENFSWRRFYQDINTGVGE